MLPPLLPFSNSSSSPPLQITLLPGMDYMNFDPLSTSEPYTSSAGIFGGKVRSYTNLRSHTLVSSIHSTVSTIISLDVISSILCDRVVRDRVVASYLK